MERQVDAGRLGWDWEEGGDAGSWTASVWLVLIFPRIVPLVPLSLNCEYFSISVYLIWQAFKADKETGKK